VPLHHPKEKKKKKKTKIPIKSENKNYSCPMRPITPRISGIYMELETL